MTSFGGFGGLLHAPKFSAYRDDLFAQAHVRHWAKYQSWETGSITITVNEGTKIDAFIHEHQY